MIRVAIQESDELKIDPEVSPYKDMIAQEARWWAYPEARSTRMWKAAVEAKQATTKKKESRATAAEEAEVQQSSNSDESEDEVSLNVRPKKGASQQKQVTFEDKTECNYAGCK